eukprot:g39442.t1
MMTMKPLLIVGKPCLVLQYPLAKEICSSYLSSRSRSSDEEQEDERPQRKRLNRIEDEDEEEDDDEDEDEPALTSRFRGRPARDYSKKYRLMSDEEEEELEEVGKETSSLDCGLVVLPSTNGQSAGQASENVISRTSEKNQMAKDTNPTPSPALNGACEAMASEAGVEAGGDGGEEEEDDLLGLTMYLDQKYFRKNAKFFGRCLYLNFRLNADTSNLLGDFELGLRSVLMLNLTYLTQ